MFLYHKLDTLFAESEAENKDALQQSNKDCLQETDCLIYDISKLSTVRSGCKNQPEILTDLLVKIYIK